MKAPNATTRDQDINAPTLATRGIRRSERQLLGLGIQGPGWAASEAGLGLRCTRCAGHWASLRYMRLGYMGHCARLRDTRNSDTRGTGRGCAIHATRMHGALSEAAIHGALGEAAEYTHCLRVSAHSVAAGLPTGGRRGGGLSVPLPVAARGQTSFRNSDMGEKREMCNPSM